MGNIGSTMQPSMLDRYNSVAGLNTTQGAQYRVTPENYRQVLGDNADVVLSPKDMKDMYEKGYLDVQRQFTQQESNEGILTIATKAFAALIGPSKSIGAIQIDPKFLDMIKDPNAEVGFGYTRLKQESLKALPYPNDPPKPERPARPTEPSLQQTHFEVKTPTQVTEQHRDQLVKFRKEQEERLTTSGQSTYVLTGTENWSEEEVNGVNDRRNYQHGNSVLTTGFRDMIGMQGEPESKKAELTRYAIMSAYLDPGSYGTTGASNGTRNGLEMANTVSSFSNNFIGTELNRLRGDGEHFEYNKPYGFMTLGSMANEKVQGNPDLEGDFVKFKAKDLMRTTPGLTQEAATAQATEFLNQNPSVNGADLFTLVTSNTTLGEADGGVADSGKLQARYKELLVTEGHMSPEDVAKVDISKVTLSDFYALQYNASAINDTRSGINTGKVNYPPNKISVSPDGHVQIEGRLSKGKDGNFSVLTPGSQQNAVRDVMNMRVVAETNFGRRTGESLMFGSDRINHKAESLGMSSRLDETDAANVTGTVQDLDQRLENAGLTGAGGILKRGETPVNLVPEGWRNKLIQTLDSNPTLKAANQSFYNGLKASPAVVTVADANKFKNDAQAQHVSLPSNMSRITNETRIANITQQEWNTILPMVSATDGPSADGRSAQKLARDGQFVVTQPGGETVVSKPPTQEAEVSGTEMIALAQGTAEPGTVNEIKTALAISDNEIKTALGDSPSPEALQGYLFQRVMTDVMGQSSEQATTALTATKTNKTFTFPENPGTPGQGVKITEPVKTVDVGEPQQVLDLNSVSASLQGNLATMGDLVANPVLILNDQDKAGLETLKNQIRSDIAALKANGVETVMIGQTKVKISDLEAQLPEKFAAIDANVAKGDELVRGKMLEQGLSNREEFVGGLNSATSTDARFAGMPPIPPVPAPGSEAATKYPEAIHDSASKFVDSLQEALGDGKITEAEHSNMKAWVDTSRQNLATSLGVDVNTLSGVGLSTKLKDKGYSDAQISDITRTVNVLNEAQANINVVPEAVAFDDARKMVADLRTKIQEFDTVGVVRNAFVGEMKDLAVKTPDKFDATIRGAYQLPPKGESPEADKLVADLTTMAKEGKTPVPPNISFVDPNVIKGANAAYIRNGENNEPTILLSRDLLSKPADLRNALAEEMFHHIEGQTQEFRAQEAFNKLPEDFQAKLKAEPPLSTDALAAEVAKLNPQQQQVYSDYNSAKAGTFDVKGDEGRAGLRALRAAQQGQSVSMIQSVADKARMETSDGVANLNSDAKVDGKLVGGYDHGTVTINGKSYQAEFQTAAVESGSEPARSTYADTGLNVTPNNPHATDRTYTEPVSNDNPWGNNTPPSPAEASRRSYLSNLDNQIQNFDLMPQVDDTGKALSPEARAQKKQGLVNERNAVQNMTAQDFAATNARNNKIGQLRTALANLEKSPPIGPEGKPISPAQAAQEKIKLENELNTVQNQSAQEFAQQNGMLSQHQMEAKDDSFWGKAREMGGQAINAMLQMLGSGAVGQVFDQIAQGIENAWKGFYARNTGNSSAADRTQAEDVVQHGFDVGRDGNYDASRTNLINPGGKNAVAQSTQQYQQQNPGLTGDRKGFMQQWWESREKGSV